MFRDSVPFLGACLVMCVFGRIPHAQRICIQGRRSYAVVIPICTHLRKGPRECLPSPLSLQSCTDARSLTSEKVHRASTNRLFGCCGYAHQSVGGYGRVIGMLAVLSQLELTLPSVSFA